jgi:hypothetical protein
MKQLELLDDITSLLFTIERDNPQLRSPSFELSHPIRDGGIGNDDQNWESLELLRDGTEKGGHLHRFAEAHVVRQDAGLMVPPIVAQPIESVNLSDVWWPPQRQRTRLDVPGTASA